jgi:benzoylformate decarboxylase
MDLQDMAGKPGRFKIIEQFLADGMNVMFGNPGTVEQGFLDALWDYPEMKYILTLQESVPVMMGDGYARYTQKPTLVQIHSTPGLGNAIGAIYQAYRGHSPLVIIGGDAGISYLNMDAQMAGDLVAFARPVTKYSTMVTDSRSLLRTLRRAIKIAGTPPMGPVYVCLPMDILDEINDEDVYPTTIPSTRVKPDESFVNESVKLLSEASKPVIFMGDGVAYSQATDELTHLAELLGAEVYGVDVGDFCMDYTHPCYQGTTGHMFGSFSKPICEKGDVILIVGTYMLPEVFPELGNVYSNDAKVIHIDLNAYEIGKNHRVDLASVCDPKLGMNELINGLNATLTVEQKNRAKERLENLKVAKENKIAHEKEQDKAILGNSPLKPEAFMEELAKHIPEDTIIFDESLTSSPALTRYIPPRKPGTFFQTRGGSLGVGIPGAMGLQVANPDKLVIGFTGDGGSMYTIQALWTAVRHNINAKFVICNNASYKLLQLNVTQYWKEREIPKHEYPLSFDLSYPPLRFDKISESLGVPALRVEKPEQIKSAIEQMLAHKGPFLIDLVLESDVRPDLIGVRCGQ